VHSKNITSAIGHFCVIVALVAASGCLAVRRPLNPFAPPEPAAPVVLTPQATLDQVIGAVNANTQRVRSYVTYDAKISTPGALGVPLLTAAIAAEQPGRFRLRASTAITGPEIDLGSNHEEFWFWIKRSQPAALYVCRHDQFANSPARDMLPIEPAWVADAVGLVTLDPTLPWEGPTPRGNGTLELRSAVYHPTGTRSRVTVVDAERAWVLEQHLYDAAGQLLASSKASRFTYDATAQVSLPRQVEVSVPAQGVAFTIDMGRPTINVPPGDPAQLWTRPTIDGVPTFDLGSMAAPVAESAPVQQRAVPFASEALAAAPATLTSPENRASVLDTPPAATAETTPLVGRLPTTGVALESR
jgi:hypothetical protein